MQDLTAILQAVLIFLSIYLTWLKIRITHRGGDQ